MKILNTEFEDIFVTEMVGNGPTVAIMGGVHGDEGCGVVAYEWLLNEFLPNLEGLRGRVFLIKGNPLACSQNVRFVEADLNRLYGDGNKKENYEERRVEEIKVTLDECEALLDIHSTSRPSVPMTCSTGRAGNLKIARKLPVEYITIGWEGKTSGMASDDYMEAQGKVGVTVECGWSQDPEGGDIAKRAAKAFLQEMNMLSDEIEAEKYELEPRILELYETIFPESENFKFVDGVVSFMEFKAGEKYADDGNAEYRAEEDTFIVMPVKTIKMNVEACFLAREHRPRLTN